MSPRCPATGSDGRRCTLLEGHEKKHLVASEPLTLNAVAVIMLRRGWGIRSAYRLLKEWPDGASNNVERLLWMLAVSENAGLHRDGPTVDEVGGPS